MCYWLLFLFSFQSLLFSDHFLTFIVPCYNCEKWVEEAVESIYNQKNLSCPFEIICTDDGSTDATYPLLSTLRKKHPELRLFQHQKNRGGGACRNTCVSHAQGDLIFCLDADNILAPNSVQALIDHLDQTGDDIAAFGTIRYFTDHHLITGLLLYYSPNDQYTLEQILQNTDSPPWSGNYLYTKSSYLKAGGYPENLKAMDTFGFGFLQLLHGCKMGYVPNTFYLHRHGIESYYVRESSNKNLTKIFCTFLLSHEKLFTPKTIKTLKKHLKLAKKEEPGKDPILLLSEKKIELKSPLVYDSDKRSEHGSIKN